jgi:hypothetical protein
VNAEIGAENKWNIGKKALSGKRKEDKRRNEPNQSQTWANPPTHADLGLKERRQREVKAKGATLGAHALGTAAPPSAPQAHPLRADSDQYGGWWCVVDPGNIPSNRSGQAPI